MPLYEYECSECKNEFEEICKVRDRRKDPPCPICGGPGRRVLSTSNIQTDTPAWIDDQVRTCLGEPVRTRTELNRVLKEKNLEPAC